MPFIEVNETPSCYRVMAATHTHDTTVKLLALITPLWSHEEVKKPNKVGFQRSVLTVLLLGALTEMDVKLAA